MENFVMVLSCLFLQHYKCACLFLQHYESVLNEGLIDKYLWDSDINVEEVHGRRNGRPQSDRSPAC